MNRSHAWVALVLSVCLALVGMAQEQPPPTGKLSWDLYLQVERGRRSRARGEEVPVISALLIAREDFTRDDITRLSSAGYVVKGALGNMALVEAPADLYGDPNHGVDALPFIASATLPLPVISNDSPMSITNGTPAINAPAAWNLGHRGAGTRIAIIDEGYDLDNPVLASLNPTYYLIVPTGFESYEVREGEVGTISDHGTSCAIIAGDVAPEADLFLISYPPRTGWLGWLFALYFAVRDLGVDVVSSSVEPAQPTCHADGTGVNEVVSDILAGTDTLLCVAAGNWAAGSGADRWHYYSAFRDQDHDYLHDFTSGSEDEWDRNTLTFTGNEGDRIVVVLEWNDWDRDQGTQDLDILLYDADYHELLRESRTQQFESTSPPYEGFVFVLPYDGRFAIQVENRGARWHSVTEGEISFHLYVFNASHRFDYVEHHTPCMSVREVATSSHPQVLVVGAVAVGSGEVRPYSSRGLTSDGRPKPDILAPDGVTGTAYPQFFGTSASAPYVAGAVALLLSANPELTPEEVRAALGLDRPSGIDGCGNSMVLLDLERALAFLP